MIWLSFERWTSAQTRLFHMRRILRKGYRWTPFVDLRIRPYVLKRLSSWLLNL